jgi:tetratricopeptide (TPR) repeat protein
MAQEQTRQFIEQATQSIQGGQFQGALVLIDQALALDPSDSDAHILRGICLSQTGQPAAATDAFNRAISLDPSSAKAKYNLGVHQYALGQKQEALRSARDAANLDPAHTGARQLISNLEVELAAPARPVAQNHNDPLAQPPIIPSPTPSVTSAPQANPYGSQSYSSEAPRPQPEMPTPPPAGVHPVQAPNPYMKNAYEGPAHSIPLVESIGNAWIVIGWGLALLSLLSVIFYVLIVVEVVRSGNFNDPKALEAAMRANGGLMMATQVSYYGSLLGIIIWSIMDIIDRRGNFIWLIPNMICSCCGGGWITLPIYILAGRNN